MKFLLSTNCKIVCGSLLAICLGPVYVLGQVKQLSEPPAIEADQFVRLHALIKPQAGELRFSEIPWLLSVWEARQQAAQEGKPILVWSGSGGAPLGVC